LTNKGRQEWGSVIAAQLSGHAGSIPGRSAPGVAIAGQKIDNCAPARFTGTSHMSKNKESVFNFEESLADLERLVSAMEEGDLSLEESLAAFEKGIRLTRECQTALQSAEQKVQMLIDSNHDPDPVNFDPLTAGPGTQDTPRE